jgi:hypothetical protein
MKSARGNQCILICCNYDSNAILTEALETRAAAEINNALTKLLDTLINSGHRPKLHVLDNKASDTLKHSLLKNQISFRMGSPASPSNDDPESRSTLPT